MERLDEIFDEFEERLRTEEQAATERKLRQEAETKRAFEVGQRNLHALVVPALEVLAAEVEARGHEFKFVENNGGNRPMIAVTFRAKRNGAFLSKAVSSLVLNRGDCLCIAPTRRFSLGHPIVRPSTSRTATAIVEPM